MFSAIGYLFAAQLLTPTQFNVPQSRDRYYMLAKRKMLSPGMDNQSYQADIDQWFKKIRQQFTRQPTYTIHDFLLKSDSNYVGSFANDLSAVERYDSGDEWVKHHEQVFRAQNCARPQRVELLAFFITIRNPGQRKWIASRPVREQEMMFYWSTVVPPTTEKTVDISQCITRAQPMDGVFGCFTGSSLPYLILERRIVTGRERLATQSISLHQHINGTPDSMLGDLAGNAFSACCFGAALIAVVSK